MCWGMTLSLLVLFVCYFLCYIYVLYLSVFDPMIRHNLQQVWDSKTMVMYRRIEEFDLVNEDWSQYA